MIVGNERNQSYLLRAMDAGVLAHAYLLSGPANVGKRTLALAAARRLLCENPKVKKLEACGACRACELVAGGTHPDIVFLSREVRLATDPEKKEIGIADIQSLREQVSRTPFGGKRIIAVIDGIEILSADAKTALLKTLEEPGAHVTFFLISDSVGTVLPTIRSRTVPLHFSFVSDEACAPLLEGVSASRAKELLELANGRPGLLVRMRDDAAFRTSVHTDHERFEKLRRSGLVGHFAFSEAEAREVGNLEAYCGYLLERGHRALRTAPVDQGPRIAEILRAVLAALALIRGTTVNRRLVADGLFFELSGLMTPSR